MQLVILIKNKYMEKAIKKAIEGGYKNTILNTWDNFKEPKKKIHFYRILLDPLFWVALGHAEGWYELKYKRPLYLERDGEYGEIEYALYYWHKFIDHRYDCGDIESWFNNILN